MLREVHCSENTIPRWSAEWGYKMAMLEIRVELLFFLTTASALKFKNPFRIQTADILSVILRQIRNVSLELHYMHLMTTIKASLKLSSFTY
jgi:hypothetical protein